ncbi:MAG TPA: transcription termination factor NusA [Polyangiaceae bacterium LLY-WYZ-14_1]|jgi:N utilization substance protein A|nr:transcription termination factor NusA [Polyangiaceae bacterium LLY-WYZ-14_1]
MQQGSFTLQHVIDQVSQEKGIEPSVLVEATEQAILTAAKRTFGMNRELEARYNEDTGWVDLFQYMVVVEDVESDEREIHVEDAKRHGLEAEVGEELGFQIFYRPEDMDRAREQDREFGDLLKLQQHRRGFGRIAAQTAKQVIIQRVRDAERERIFNEFKDRRGEIITGVVRRFERGNNIIVDLGRNVEAILPPREQTPRESYRPGDRIVALLKDIDREARGPQLILSRTDVGLLVKLFEMEVPEIYEGIVRIVAAAREPGARSKIAVSSRDSDVDPVGACVGMKGSRVQAVVQELRGEKIDIVPWDRDPARFVCNAIAPAEVVRVVIDEGNAQMELVVPDAKLSLAIGRRGQNVRLASQLTGWRLDIISESRFRQMEDEAMAALSAIPGVDAEQAKAIYKMGFRTLDEIAEASERELASIPGIGEEYAVELRGRAAEALESQRLARLDELAQSREEVTDRDRLMLMAGMSERVAESLEAAGYRTPEDIHREEEPDRLALRAQLDSSRVQFLQDAAARFVEVEWPPVEAGRAALPEPEPEVEDASTAGGADDGAPDGEAPASPGDASGSSPGAPPSPSASGAGTEETNV